MNTQKNPYIGPRTFQRNEGHLFFGREREARDLISLVASERLVVFYAQSGAGKSSIVNTRLIPNLEEKQYEVLPVGRVSGNSGEGLEVNNIYIYNLLRSLEQHEEDPSRLARLSLAQFLCQLNYDDKGFFYDPTLPDSIPGGEDEAVIRRALIIDQFEELFSTHPEAWEKREDFFAQVAQAMQDDPHLWLVLVMREDYIAALDPYAHLVSNGLRVRYYMQRLGREAGLKAVKSPVEGIRPYAAGVAEKLIDDLCSIKVQQPDGTLDVQPGQYVEPVQMQVVCYGLWDNLSPDGTQITEKDLQDVGDVNQSLGKYYDKRVGEVAKARNVRERMIREWFEKKLITAGGIRNMVLQEREPRPGELSDEVIQALQSDLVRGEKRGGATWYELTHDRLVEPILERNKIWFSENLSPLQRQAALWKDQDQNESWLLRDQALVEVQEWAEEHKDELTETEDEFLTACQKLQAQIDERHAAERNRLEMAQKLAEEQARSAQRSRRFSILSLGLLVISIVAVIVAASAYGDTKTSLIAAETAKAEAVDAQNTAEEVKQEAHAGELSFIALEKAEGQLDLALLLGLQADAINPSPQTQKALLTLMQRSSRYLGTKTLENDVLGVQYSPDSKTFALLDENGVTFWDAKTRQSLSTDPLNGHYGAVTAMTLNADSTLMASGGANGTIVIWDAINRQKLSATPKEHTSWIRELVFSPTEPLLASASSNEKNILLWDISDPASPRLIEKRLQNDSNVFSITISPDGKTLAAGDAVGNITLWDVNTQERISRLPKGHSFYIFGVKFTPDGKTLASASYDDSVILWDVSDLQNPKQKSKPLTGHNIDIETLAVSPDGNTVATGDDASNIILWDAKTGERKNDEPLNGSASWVVSLGFSPDSKILAAGYFQTGKVILWDVESETQIGETIQAHRTSVWGVAFDRDGKTLISASEDSAIIYWDISDAEAPQKMGAPLRGIPGQPYGMRLSPDGSLLQTDGFDGTVLFDVKKKERLGYGNFLPVPPDSDFVAYTLNDGSGVESAIYLRDSASGQEIGASISGTNPHFSPDGSLLFYETIDPDTQEITTHLWDVATGQDRDEEFKGSYITFNPQSQVLVYQTQNEDGEAEIVFWDLEKLAAIKTIPAANLSHMTASQDGTTLAFILNDSENEKHFINLLNTSSTEDLMERKEIGNQGSIYQLSATGDVLLYYSNDSPDSAPTLRALNTANGALIGSPEPGQLTREISESGQFLVYEYTNQYGETRFRAINTKNGTEVLPSPKGTFLDIVDDDRLLAYSDEKGITLWDLTKNQSLGGPIRGTYQGISPDGQSLITSNSTNSLLFWDLTKTWPLGTPLGDMNDPVSNAVLGLNGSSLAWISKDGVRVQDTSDGAIQGPFKDHIAGLPGSNVFFSPDGKMLAITDGGTNTTTLWDLDAQEVVKTEIPGTQYLVFSPRSELVVIGDGNTSTATIWDLRTREQIGPELPGLLPIFSQDGNWLVLINWNTSSTIVWDVKQRKSVNTIAGTNVTLSPSGKLLAIANLNENTTTVWDINKNDFTDISIPGNYSFAFSPSGRYLAVGDYSTETTTVLDVLSNEEVGAKIPGFNLFSSPNSDLLAIINNNSNTTALWNWSSQKIVAAEIPGASATFSPNGDLLTIADGVTARLWDVRSATMVSDDLAGNFMAFSPDGKWIAIGNGSTTRLWDVDAKKMLGDEISGSGIAFSPSGKWLAVGDYSSKVTKLWNTASKTMLDVEIPGFNPVFDMDGNVLAVSNSDTAITVLWDVREQKQVEAEIPGSAVVFSPAGKWLAVQNFNANTTSPLDISNLREKLEPIEQPASARNVTFSPDGSVIASYHPSDGIVLRDLEQDKSVMRLATEDYTNRISMMNFYADGARLAALVPTLANDGMQLITWDTASGNASFPGETDQKFPTDKFYPMFSPDGNYLLYVGGKSLEIWDVIKNEPYVSAVETINIDPTRTNIIRFSPDGKVMSYTDGRKIFLYRFPELIKMGEPFSPGIITSEVSLVMEDTAVKYLITRDDVGNAQIWEWATQTKIGGSMPGYLQFIGSNTTDRAVFYVEPFGRLIKFEWDLDHQSWLQQLCPLTERNFTIEEWAAYFHDEGEYPARQADATCPQWPLDAGGTLKSSR